MKKIIFFIGLFFFLTCSQAVANLILVDFGCYGQMEMTYPEYSSDPPAFSPGTPIELLEGPISGSFVYDDQQPALYSGGTSGWGTGNPGEYWIDARFSLMSYEVNYNGYQFESSDGTILLQSNLYANSYQNGKDSYLIHGSANNSLLPSQFQDVILKFTTLTDGSEAFDIFSDPLLPTNWPKHSSIAIDFINRDDDVGNSGWAAVGGDVYAGVTYLETSPYCFLASKFVETNLSNGMEYYTDRVYTLTSVPSAYIGMDTILTPNDDRDLSSPNDYLTFEMPYDGIVYVAFDSRATSLPSWMSGFSDTGNRIYTSLKTQPYFRVLSKSFSAGDCVNLDGNKDSGFAGGTVSNYLVFYGTGGGVPPTCSLAQKLKKTMLSKGIRYYTDRDYTLTNVPSDYAGMDTIITPNDDRNLTTASDYLTFEMPYDGTVYVAFDSRAISEPNWMNGFIDTGDILLTSLSSQPSLKIFSQMYDKEDCVNFGANKAPGFVGGTVSNYIVFYGDGNIGPGDCTLDTMFEMSTIATHTYNLFSRVVIAATFRIQKFQRSGTDHFPGDDCIHAHVSVLKLANNLARNKLDTAVYFVATPRLTNRLNALHTATEAELYRPKPICDLLNTMAPAFRQDGSRLGRKP
jgi:hypothetical protein